VSRCSDSTGCSLCFRLTGSDLYEAYRQAHTHAHPRLTVAAAEAAGRYGHVLFPSGTHAPALELAEKLLDTVGKGWAERVFYSDNGSTGMEVALKMALRASGRRYGWEGVVGENVGVIGLKGGYHGDTVRLETIPLGRRCLADVWNLVDRVDGRF